jgi:hypothetical protein
MVTSSSEYAGDLQWPSQGPERPFRAANRWNQPRCRQECRQKCHAGGLHALEARERALAGARVYVAAAIEDASFPDEQKERLIDALQLAHVHYAVETLCDATLKKAPPKADDVTLPAWLD